MRCNAIRDFKKENPIGDIEDWNPSFQGLRRR